MRSAVWREQFQRRRAQIGSGEQLKAQKQAEAIKLVEELMLINSALESTDERHNDDSMLQYMLFSSA